MDDTVTVDKASGVFASGVADGHIAVLGQPIALPEPASFFNGAGGMVSTADDMAAWLIAQQNGGVGPGGERVLSAEGIRQAHTPSSGVPGAHKALGWNARETSNGNPLIRHGGVQFTYTAGQALLPESGYGIAVMANSGLGRADSATIMNGLIGLTEGEEPASSPAGALLAVDVVLIALSALAVVLGVRGIRRSALWAERRMPRPWWGTVLRLLPYVFAVFVAIRINRLVAPLAGGRDLPWIGMVYLVPTLMLFLLVTAAVCLAVLIARATHLLQRRCSATSERPLVGADG